MIHIAADRNHEAGVVLFDSSTRRIKVLSNHLLLRQVYRADLLYSLTFAASAAGKR